VQQLWTLWLLALTHTKYPLFGQHAPLELFMGVCPAVQQVCGTQLAPPGHRYAVLPAAQHVPLPSVHWSVAALQHCILHDFTPAGQQL
jgi:hypothetical protein